MLSVLRFFNKKLAFVIIPGMMCLFASKSITAQHFVNAQTIPIKEVNYETHIKPIILNHCVTCHSGEDPSGGLNLESYKNVRFAAEKGELLKRINDPVDPMPDGGLMPKEERLMIVKWAKNHFAKKAQKKTNSSKNLSNQKFIPPVIKPVAVDKNVFRFFEQMQGQWVGKMTLMGRKIPWFAFDYRPIAPSHVHGIFEGGTMGNLFTAFFIANFKGTKTIMVRNGGVLNGFYRTSYFILDKVNITAQESYYRFVDAYGGKDIMWMELRFKGNRLKFNSYTSRLGVYPKPRAHMLFTARKTNLELAKKAAAKVGYPKNVAEKNFPKGLPLPNWGAKYPTVTSASYLWRDASLSVEKMAKLSTDPYRIDQIPYLSTLALKFAPQDQAKKIHVYLSKEPLTDINGKLKMAYGYIQRKVMDQVLLFPEIRNPKKFLLTYLHPGEYYLTIVQDNNNDYIPSRGDMSSKSQKIIIKPKSRQSIIVNRCNVQN